MWIYWLYNKQCQHWRTLVSWLDLSDCVSGSRLLYVLRADAVSPRQQEEPLLPAVAGPRRPLRHPHQLLGRRHARAAQVPQGVPQGVPLPTQTQGQEIRSLVLTGRPKPPTYYKSIAIDIILKLPKVHKKNWIHPIIVSWPIQRLSTTEWYWFPPNSMTIFLQKHRCRQNCDIWKIDIRY